MGASLHLLTEQQLLGTAGVALQKGPPHQLSVLGIKIITRSWDN